MSSTVTVALSLSGVPPSGVDVSVAVVTPSGNVPVGVSVLGVFEIDLGCGRPLVDDPGTGRRGSVERVLGSVLRLALQDDIVARVDLGGGAERSE